MARKKKESPPPPPPAPYITPPEWLAEAVDFAAKIKAEVGLIKWTMDRHNAGEMESGAFDEHVHDHVDNIENLTVDLELSLERAVVGASAAEDAVSTALEELRGCWWRLKKLTA